jgi:hypothetical protein
MNPLPLPSYRIGNWSSNKLSEMVLDNKEGEFYQKTDVQSYFNDLSFPTLVVVRDEPSAGSEPDVETKIFATEVDKKRFIDEWITAHILRESISNKLGTYDLERRKIIEFENRDGLHYLIDSPNFKPFSYQ